MISNAQPSGGKSDRCWSPHRRRPLYLRPSRFDPNQHSTDTRGNPGSSRQTSQFARGGELSQAGASHSTDGREMSLLMGTPIEHQSTRRTKLYTTVPDAPERTQP